MTGKRTSEQISYNMSRIRGKDTKIELMLRKELWSRGIRYRKNVNHIIGKPDIAFIGLKVAVFCDSEFWHGHNWKERKHAFKTNKEKWIAKIERNIERDGEVNRFLEGQGWTVLRFWGNEIKNDVSGCADEIESVLIKKGYRKF